ncbi:MAG: hypothetical protein R6U86_10845 [Bacteroidales bacterium]
MNQCKFLIFLVLFVVLGVLPCTAAAGNITETGAAIGYLCTASGNYSTAMGFSNTAGDDYSTAMGAASSAYGVASTVMGYQNTASEDYSTAIGMWVKASGQYATAMGFSIQAEARSSTVIGRGIDRNRRLINHIEDSFMVGYMADDEDTIPEFFVQHGGVGINTTTPSTSLHVQKNISGGASMANHVAAIENTSEVAGPDVLMLKVNNTGPGTACNFITFRDRAKNLGSIEGNGSGGIRLNTSGGDFAEYLPKADPDATLAPGDIVGLFPDGLSKRTQNALRVMVVTTAPAILGHYTDANNTSSAGVAFMGQVTIRVEGEVTAGDYIVASGRADGIGFAVAPSEISSAHYAGIAGRALTSDSRQEIKLVTALIGTPQHILRQDIIQAKKARIEALDKRLALLENESQESTASGLLPGVGIFAGGLGLLFLDRRRRHL